MATLVLRAGKGSPLTNAEVDANFTNLNTEVAAAATTATWAGVTGKPATLAGYGITDAQPVDADLTAIAALAGTSGFLKKTAANTWALDTATYLTGINSSQVTTALGFTPYNATNPSGYITASASITGNAATATALQTARTINGVSFNGTTNITIADATKLPLTGGTLTGPLVVTSTGGSATDGLIVNSNGASGLHITPASGDTTQSGRLFFTTGTAGQGFSVRNSAGSLFIQSGATYGSSSGSTVALSLSQAGALNTAGAITQNGSQVLTAGNVSTYALPIGGGTLTGPLTLNNATKGNQLFTTSDTGNATLTIKGLNYTHTVFFNDSYNTGEYAKLSGGHLGQALLRLTGFSALNTISATSDYASNYASIAGTLSATGAITQAGNQVLHAGNYNSYSPTLTGTGASGSWGISVTGSSASTTGNAATATTLQTARTINGIPFNGSANIKTSEWFHSDRDFASGTLVTTDINYAVTNGDPFVLEIRGNSYGDAVPYDIQYQGYIYADTIINHGGHSNGTNITGLVAINVGGNLCFWWPRQSYWNGFNIRVYTAYATVAVNRVTSITSTAKPTSTKEVALSSNIRQSLHSSNFSSYALPLSGGTLTNTLTITKSGTGVGSASALNLSGDITSARGVNQGVIYLGSNGTSYLYADGSGNYILGTGSTTLSINSNLVLHAGNYTSYSPTLTGTGASGTWSISVTGSSASTTGNAATATALQTARTINGVSFNGSANITVADATKLPLAGGTMTGAIAFAAGQTWPTFNQNTTGSAGSVAWSGITSKPTTLTGYGITDALATSGGTVNGRVVVVVGGRTTSYTGSNLEVQTGDNTAPGISFHRGGYSATLLYENDGELYTQAWTTRAQTGKLLSSGNYNSYSPTLTGTGASGTWGISVTGSSASTTGNAATATTWQTARTLTIGSTGKSVNGSANVTWSHEELGAVKWVRQGTLDVNAANPTGVYEGSTGSWTNRGPSGNNAGALVNINTHPGNYFSQLWFDTAGNGIYHRTGNGVLPTAAWERIVTNSGTWGISISGNAATVTNGLVSTGSYADPAWITSLASSKLTGTIDNARLNGGTYTINVTGSSGSTTGNAASATRLINLRTINGVGFDGTANITVADATKLPLSGGTLTGQVTINAVGTAGSPTLRLNTSSSAAYVHIQENLAAGLTAGQHAVLIVGKEANTKNSGYIGYHWAGAASNSNYVTIGHWGADALLRVYGDGNVTVGANAVLHAGNYNTYAPTKTGGGASGTWGISVTGSAASATNAVRLVFDDGPRDLSNRLPNSFTRTVNFDFVGAGTGNGTGNYAGVMTFSPWTGTTASTGDSSYQLAFANTSGVNASGQPKLSIRNGIDSTWNAWYTLLHSGNYNSYALPLSGGTLTGALNWAASAGLGNGNARSLVTGYSGGNYGQTGYGISFTGTSGLHNYAINDIVSLWEAYDGLKVYAAAGGAVGSAITWTTVLDARRSNPALVFKGQTVLDAGNYNSYSPSLTGTGASGSWGITVTGSAATLTTARTINGTSFNGSANITTANWGTARTLTLGATGKSVSGAANVSWTFSEIAAGQTITTSGSTASLILSDTGASGANLRLIGNGATTPNKTIRAQSGLFQVINNAYTAPCMSVDDAGNFTANANVIAYSDERLKKDWAPVASDFVARLATLKSGTYTRIDSGERQAGSSAQDWQKLLPEVVASKDETGILGLAYGNAALVSAIELAKRVVEQEERIARLEALVEKLIGA